MFEPYARLHLHINRELGIKHLPYTKVVFYCCIFQRGLTTEVAQNRYQSNRSERINCLVGKFPIMRHCHERSIKNISVSSEQFILFRALMIYGFIQLTKALIVGNGLYGKKLMLLLAPSSPPPSPASQLRQPSTSYAEKRKTASLLVRSFRQRKQL